MLEFNPYSWEFHEDPYPIYKRLRDEAPLYRNEELGFWALSRHADVLRACKDWETFSSSEGVALEAFSPEAWRVAFFLAMDPPRHDRLRGLVSKAFTPRRVLDVEPRVRALAREYFDAIPVDGTCDFIADFSGKLPMDVISDMIGVPASDRDTVRGWADGVLHREEGDSSVPVSAMQASGNLLGYLRAMVEDRRRRGGDDMTAALMEAEIDGERLGDDEVVSFLFLMSIAGNETTTKLLGNALYWAQAFPEQLAKVRADAKRIPGWVEETLRFDNSSQIVYRTVAREVEIHGRSLAVGDRVALLLGAANRDERCFRDPDVYDVERDCGNSLSFGRGVHFCLGANLARLEGRVCLEELMARYQGWEIDEAGLVRVHSGNVRGFAAMPMRLKPR